LSSAPGAAPPVRPRHVALLLVLAGIWGSSFFVIKIGVADIPALNFTALRLMLAMTGAVLVSLVIGRGLSRDPVLWRAAFFFGLFGNALPFFLISWGVEAIDSALAAILMATMPLCTAVLAHFFAAGDRLTPPKATGVGLGFCGIVVLVGPAALQGLGGELPRQLATAGGAVCYAISVVLARNAPPAPLAHKVSATMIWSCLLVLAGALVTATPWQVPTVETIVAAAYLGLVATAFANVVFFHLVSQQTPSFVAFLNYLIPVFGIGFGAVILDEAITLQAVGALAMILGGIFIASRRRLT